MPSNCFWSETKPPIYRDDPDWSKVMPGLIAVRHYSNLHHPRNRRMWKDEDRLTVLVPSNAPHLVLHPAHVNFVAA